MSLLIAAGPTHEPIDAVRYIANRSSGRLGIALAETAASRGLATTLLLGPTALAPTPDSHLTVRRFRTAGDLRSLLADLWPRHDVLIMAAAVADYRPVEPLGPQVKKPRGPEPWTLRLEPTPDLLAEAAAAARPGQVTVGFALAAGDSLARSARAKLAAKGVDAIVANPLETMGADRIRATLLLRDGSELAPPGGECTKREFAGWLLDRIALLRAARSPV